LSVVISLSVLTTVVLTFVSIPATQVVVAAAMWKVFDDRGNLRAQSAEQLKRP
jgi:hypothetical protein